MALVVPTYSKATGQAAPDRVSTPQALGAPRQQIDYSGLDLAARISEKTGASVQDAGEHLLARQEIPDTLMGRTCLGLPWLKSQKMTENIFFLRKVI